MTQQKLLDYLFLNLSIFNLMTNHSGLEAFLKNHFYFHWLHKRPGYAHLFNIGSGLFFWLFLWVALPFGISIGNNSFKSILMLGFYLLPLGVAWSLIFFTGDWVFKKYFSADSESQTKNSLISWIVRLLVLIHFIIIFREVLCEGPCIDVKEYFDVWIACILLFSLSYIPYSLYGRYLYFHSLVSAEKVEDGAFTLNGEGKESIAIQLDQIIYFQSSDNYVDIYLAKEMNPGKRIIFRCTLKSIEEQLADFPQFIRIHRSFLVNTQYIAYSSGWNIRKQIEMSFRDYQVSIPVSRSYLETLTNLFTHPK